MLPEQLSNHTTSLLEDVERLSVVIELVVDAEGEVTSTEVYRARVRNHAKLVYERIGAWLEGHTPVPPEVSKVAGLEEQLRLQDSIFKPSKPKPSRLTVAW
jgi:exoribonuclease-2